MIETDTCTYCSICVVASCDEKSDGAQSQKPDGKRLACSTTPEAKQTTSKSHVASKVPAAVSAAEDTPAEDTTAEPSDSRPVR